MFFRIDVMIICYYHPNRNNEKPRIVAVKIIIILLIIKIFETHTQNIKTYKKLTKLNYKLCSSIVNIYFPDLLMSHTVKETTNNSNNVFI
jgi:hypothetical protein